MSPDVQAATIKKLAEALHWRGEGRKTTWDEAVAECAANGWGVCEFYREWAVA